MIKKAIWLYGLSGAGKTTLANKLTSHYSMAGISAVLLDADVLRAGINKNLGFTAQDRIENIRRIAEIAKLFLQSNIIPIVTAITPYSESRKEVTAILGVDNVLLVHINCSLEKCEERDVKGLYQKARQGLIKNFTGIGDAFEMPEKQVPSINTTTETEQQSFDKLLHYIHANS